MAGSTSNNQRSLTLVELLNEPQPYTEINRLRNSELTESDRNDPMLSKIQGSLIGLAIGDALGAPVEFRPRTYLEAFPVSDMQAGGTWGLAAGQFTDDTSMALCLGASLIVKGQFDSYDQLVRYKRWYRQGYMSSTGRCFDIGGATRDAIHEFEKRQRKNAQILQKQSGKTIPEHFLDREIEKHSLEIPLDVQCGAFDAAGNGPLMRLAPVPLFYHQSETDAIQNAGSSVRLTHGDPKAIDACAFYSCLIWNAIHGKSKKELLDSNFFEEHFRRHLHADVMEVVRGSYKEKDGYAGGIRGKGYIISALEAALWAFYNDGGSFEVGVLLAINLGDDTDTTAAIYGQLAGAVYGIEGIPQRWRDQIFQKDFLIAIANGLFVRGKNFNRVKRGASTIEDSDQETPPSKRRNPNSGISKPVNQPASD